MADYYVEFSTAYTLPRKVAEIIPPLFAAYSEIEDFGFDENGEPTPERLAQACETTKVIAQAAIDAYQEDFPSHGACVVCRELADDGEEAMSEVVIYSDGHGDVEAVSSLLNQVFGLTSYTEPFVLEWAISCSKPRVDGFGGGVMVISRENGIRGYGTSDIVHRALRGELNEAAPSEKVCLARYQRLHDGLSEMIESGRLSEADIPDDYQWLVSSLADLANAGQQARGNGEQAPEQPAGTRVAVELFVEGSDESEVADGVSELLTPVSKPYCDTETCLLDWQYQGGRFNGVRVADHELPERP